MSPISTLTAWIKGREPVIASTVAKGALVAVGGFAVTHGWIGKTQDDTLIQVGTPVAAAAVIVVIDVIVRHLVTPTAKTASPAAADTAAPVVPPLAG